MKTFQLKFKTLFILFLVGFAFASCSKDDGDTPDPEPKNQAPNSFDLMEVADGADLQPQLSWEAAKDPDGDDVAYQVYLDSQNPPENPIASNLEINSFNVEDTLHPETTYYWKVIAKDVNGNSTESDITSFTTREMTTGEALVGKWFFENIEDEPDLSVCNKRSFM